MRKLALCIALLTVVLTAKAQDGNGLSQFFEGKQVVVKIDMPGTQQGIDIYPQKGGSLNAKDYGKRMKSFPVALHNGETVMITTVKVKDKLIEFQLGGGGFGTFGDDSDTSVKFVPESKSNHEKDLETQLKNTDDPDRRSSIQHELDYLRRQRERDDQRNREQAQRDADIKRVKVDDDRSRGGSRFNLRYDGKVPANVTPQDVMQALSQYVSFGPEIGGPAGAAPAPPAPVGSSDATGGLQKGMHEEEVRAVLGNPTGSIDTNHDGITVHSETFSHANSTVRADFVNGVLVKYSIEVR